MNLNEPSRTHRPRVTLFIPCYNEERTVVRSAQSWLCQSRLADEIVVVDDGSTDRTAELLSQFSDRITVVRTPKNTGNKSHAQEYGLQFVTGEIVVTTDADTILDEHFIEEIIKPFSDPLVAACGGYVKSIPYNWLTRCRAYDYAIGQNIHKLAQSYIGFMFVIPGAAGAFRLEAFKSYITFDHDTLTEDLDFTYKLHKRGQTIAYCRSAIVRTQDPSTLSGYVNQMRRWYGGGWQNLRKHWDLAINEPWASLELSLIYIEGLIFSLLMYAIPLIDAQLSIKLIVPYVGIGLGFGAFAAWRERRIDLTLAIFPYLFLMYVNAFVFVEQFVRVMLLGTRNLVWFKPERVEMTS